MTIRSDENDMFKIALNVTQGRINRHADLMKRFIRRRRAIGAGVGALAGGAGLAAMQNKENKSTNKRRHGSVLGAGIAGALTGGYLGSAIGEASTVRRYISGSRRNQRYANAYNKTRGWQKPGGGGGRPGAGGYSANKGGDGNHPVWGKIKDEAARRKAKGVAAHAKRTQGPEGDAAREVLKNMAKKHGVDYEDMLKHSHSKLAMLVAERIGL